MMVRRWVAGAVVVVMALGACGGGAGPSTEPAADPPATVQRLALLPDASGALGLRLHPAAGQVSNWAVWRRWPDGALRIYRTAGAGAPVVADFAESSQTMPLRVLESEGSLYLFGYDTERNIPSGRDPLIVREGVDLYRFDAAGGAPVRLAEGVALGGLDNLIHAQVRDGVVTACAVDTCLLIRPGAAVVALNNAAMTGREFVDVRFDGDTVGVLARSREDRVTGNALAGQPNYLAGRMGPTTSSLSALADDCVPQAFRMEAGEVRWSCARTAAELAQVLNEDLARMPHGGLMEFGSSNMEGRIAWSAVYYLRAMQHLASGATPRMAAAGAWPGQSARLREELDTIARLAADGVAGYTSRRYSRDRRPLIFALHLGRIAHLLGDADRAGLLSDAGRQALATLSAELRALGQTVETPVVQTQGGRDYATLGLRRGSAFWADGANVPFNFLSAIGLGLLAVPGSTPADVTRTAQLLTPLQAIELPGTSAVWRYWWGWGYTGWTATQAISTNTQEYVGQKASAHITYRSMDAMALIRLHERSPADVPAATLDHLRGLVATGELLPFVNEELVRVARGVEIPPAAARRFARSAAPWELQAQLWALESLARP